MRDKGVCYFFFFLIFFFNDTATTEIYTLSLHDALPIFNCYRKTCPHHTCMRLVTAEQVLEAALA